MALEELVDRLGTGTSRRTVVKTGAKLAYAAPLVAATMKLSTGIAGAVSGGCGTASTCGDFGPGNCPDQNCVCAGNADGGTSCVENRFPDRGVVPCTSGAGCNADEVCTLDTCSGTVCLPHCAAGGASIDVVGPRPFGGS